MRKTVILMAALALGQSLTAGNVLRDTLGVKTALSTNVTDLLLGRLSGVRVSSIDGNPVGGKNVHIRGINSLRTDNQPLWIVDGVMLSTDLNENLDAFWQYPEQSYTAPLNPLAFLNACQIESIEVLKDASATAIYGARGADGVIIVNTVKGRPGERNFSWNSDIGYTGGLYHNHFFSFNGVQGSSYYNVSGSFRSLDGALKNNNSRYGSVKGNFETKANKVVWFGFDCLLSAGVSNSPSGVTYLGLPSYTLSLMDPALSASTTREAWEKDYDDKSEDYRALMSAYLRLNFTKSLYLKIKGGFDMQNDSRVIWYGRSTWFGAPSDNNQNGGAAGNLISFLMSYNAAAELTFDRYFAQEHHLKALLGGEFYGGKNKFNTMNGTNFVSDQLRGLGLKNGAYEVNNHKFIRTNSHLAAYATASYDYKGMFGADAAFRADYAPKYLRNEIHFYPSLEAFVNFSRIINGMDAVSNLTLRGGWGVSGREKYVPYELFGNYLSGSWYEPEFGTTTFFDGLDRLRTKELSIRAEAGFLNDRFTVGAGFYDRTTSDSFVMYQMGDRISAASKVWAWGGCSKVFERESAVRNQGVEADLGLGIIRSGEWKWDVSANVSYNANRVVSTNAEDFRGREVGSGIYCTCNAYGLPISSLYGYQADAEGNYIDQTGEGRIDEADKVVLGNTIPLVYGGLQTNLQWRDLILNIELDGAAGHNVANVNRIVKDGKTDPYGVICLSSNYVEKADYLRLTQVGLKYRFPLKSKVVKGLDLKLSAGNLAVLTGYSGLNPDVNCFGASTLTNGLDYGSYPVSRTVILGANIRF